MGGGRVMGDPVREGPAAAGWQMRIWPRRDAGPLAAVMVELIDWLVTEGYAPTTQRNLVRAAARETFSGKAGSRRGPLSIKVRRRRPGRSGEP